MSSTLSRMVLSPTLGCRGIALSSLFLLFSAIQCLKIPRMDASEARGQRPEVEAALTWHVQPGRYLLMTCHFGRISNQVMCMKRSLAVAALLNRTLLLPPQGVSVYDGVPAYHWSWELVLDWNRTSKCLEPEHGPDAVIPLMKYLRQRRGMETVTIDRVHCLAPGQPTNCFKPLVLKELLQANRPYVTFPPLESISRWMKPTSLPDGKYVVSPDSVVRHLGGIEDEVLCAGELFGIAMPSDVSEAIFSSSSSVCSNKWRPHPAVISFVEGFIRHVLRVPFASVHLRRGDFYSEYVKKKHKRVALQGTTAGGWKQSRADTYTEYRPIAEVAGLLREKLAGAPHLDTLFVATDAGPLEFQFFQQLLSDPALGRTFSRVVTLQHFDRQPGWLEAQEWARQLLNLESYSSHQLGLALADKWICAHAQVFVGSEWSSFTKDIVSIRRDERLRSPRDSKLGMQPLST